MPFAYQKRQAREEAQQEKESRLQDSQTECLLTIRRATMVFIVFALFCLVGLGTPIKTIIESGITLPFVNTSINYIGFLYAGPIILISLWIYRQVFIWEFYLGDIKGLKTIKIKVIGTFHNRIGLLIGWCISTLILPLILFLFAFNAAILNTYNWFFLLAAAGSILTFGTTILIHQKIIKSIVRNLEYYLKLILNLELLIIALYLALHYHFNPIIVSEYALELFSRKLQSAKLEGHDLTVFNLSDADFTNANLERANLSHVHWENVKFTNATLNNAIISESILKIVRFDNTKLIGANLTGVKMEGADLRWAEMEGANLSGAKMKGADLSGAKMKDADLGGAEMEGAKGLTQNQVNSACFSEDSEPPILPENLEPPPLCE